MGLQSICQLSTWCQIIFFSSFYLFTSLFYAIRLFHILPCSFYFPCPLFPLTFCFNFFLFFFFFLYSLLLAEIQLSAWQITEVLKNQKCPGWPGTTSHILTRGMSFSPFLSFCSPLVSSSHFPGSSVWSHFSTFPWLQLAKPAVSIPFFFFSSTLLPSSTPTCLHFHIATGHKGTTGLICGPV